ncbi:MAG: hypothetical protein KKI08_23290 [Armatimonadetes bacterium]|nr:hypothetical protein [Armatimonadota bacterium]
MQRVRHLFRRGGPLWGLSIALGVGVLIHGLLVGWILFDVKIWRPHRLQILEPELARTVASVEPTMQALERYRENQGRYPTDLEELAPTYLAKLPELGGGLLSLSYHPPSPDTPSAYSFRIYLRGRWNPHYPFGGPWFNFLMYRSDHMYAQEERFYGRIATIGGWVYYVD